MSNTALQIAQPANGARRVPPNNTDAEASILGAILLRNAVMPAVAEKLRPEHFYDPKHVEVFRAMVAVAEAKRAIDPITLEDELQRAGKLAAVGGLAFLSELVDKTPTVDNVEYYAAIVRDKASKRDLIQTNADTIEACYADGEEAHELFGAHRREFEKLEAGITVTTSKGGRALAAEGRARILSRADSDSVDVLGVVPTGYREIDDRLGGIPVGGVSILGAVSRCGKSSLARGIAIGATNYGGVHVFSLEDAHDMWTDRMFADLSGVPLQVVKFGKMLDGSRLDRVTAQSIVAAEESPTWDRFEVDEAPSLGASVIRARVAAHAKRLGTRLVVVDYFQLMSTPSTRSWDARRATRTEALGKAMKGLVELAKDGFAVLVLVQVASEVEKEQRVPLLGDIRECGDVKNDARLVMFLHRPWRNGKMTNNAELCIAKNNNGPSDFAVPLLFVPELASYRDAPPPWMRERDGGEE